MHVLGFEHEHNRPDRDDYISIHLQNVNGKGKVHSNLAIFQRYTYKCKNFKLYHSCNVDLADFLRRVLLEEIRTKVKLFFKNPAMPMLPFFADQLTQFVKARWEDMHWTTKTSHYDYGSVMHYSWDAFSKRKGNLPTVEPLDKNARQFMGQRSSFSYSDARKINRFYDCPGTYIQHFYFCAV